MKKTLVSCLLSLVSCLCLADNAMLKTAFEQSRINLNRAPRVANPIFAECESVGRDLLRCPKSRELILASQRPQRRFAFDSVLPPPAGNYIYVVVVGRCGRIIRELDPNGGGFFGVQICD